jgi:Tol biopolymer transport system component
MLRSPRLFAAIVLLLSLAGAANSFAQQSGRSKQLTIEQLMDIKHPSNPVWSPDGSHVAFLWDRAGVTNLYVAASNGSGEPAPLTSFTDGHLGEAFWSRNSQTLFFERDGALWQAALAGGQPQPVWKGKSGERAFALGDLSK